ncbi:hypothetical protein PPL_07779 [Heterostelium album PN500]|uniref:Ankyrin repeat-containing protein n=1 Tax=Heterostelium pallidum (strain ATCC 26659 / Pp 5 / PN500) TaxID=670386 RepID=D3BGX7_HETP5|nr:hypothetical protein PPL_07779 [Heterostelium album PN500]EFA79361.1 hypothetical protein PPL_07779 [Heterostelium album PN500]|eukprot:XP_020431482.1 hypothetical protein PPL_07779 [Heterostelium album PN500]
MLKFERYINSLTGRTYYKWNELQRLPKILATHGYFNQLPKSLGQCDITTFTLGTGTHIISCAIRGGGSLAVFQYILDYFRYGSNRTDVLNNLLKESSEYGRFDIIQYLLERFNTTKWDMVKAMKYAPFSGDLQLMQFFFDKIDYDNCEDISKVYGKSFNSAAHVGRIDLIKWLVENRPQELPYTQMYLSAISYNQLPVLEYLLLEHRDLLDTGNEEYLRNAANLETGIEIFKVLYQLGCKCPPIVMSLAAEAGNLELVQWIHQNTTYICMSSTVDAAATNGHQEVTLWLLKNRTDVWYSDKTLGIAVSKGDVNTMEWLLENTTHSLTKSMNKTAPLNIVISLHERNSLRKTRRCKMVA